MNSIAGDSLDDTLELVLKTPLKEIMSGNRSAKTSPAPERRTGGLAACSRRKVSRAGSEIPQDVEASSG